MLSFRTPSSAVHQVPIKSIKKYVPNDSFFYRATKSHSDGPASVPVDADGNIVLTYKSAYYDMVFAYLNSGREPIYDTKLSYRDACEIIEDFGYFLLPIPHFEAAHRLKKALRHTSEDFDKKVYDVAKLLINVITKIIERSTSNGIYSRHISHFHFNCPGGDADNILEIGVGVGEKLTKTERVALKEFKHMSFVKKLLNSPDVIKGASKRLQYHLDRFSPQTFQCHDDEGLVVSMKSR